MDVEGGNDMGLPMQLKGSANDEGLEAKRLRNKLAARRSRERKHNALIEMKAQRDKYRDFSSKTVQYAKQLKSILKVLSLEHQVMCDVLNACGQQTAAENLILRSFIGQRYSPNVVLMVKELMKDIQHPSNGAAFSDNVISMTAIEQEIDQLSAQLELHRKGDQIEGCNNNDVSQSQQVKVEQGTVKSSVSSKEVPQQTAVLDQASPLLPNRSSMLSSDRRQSATCSSNSDMPSSTAPLQGGAVPLPQWLPHQPSCTSEAFYIAKEAALMTPPVPAPHLAVSPQPLQQKLSSASCQLMTQSLQQAYSAPVDYARQMSTSNLAQQRLPPAAGPYSYLMPELPGLPPQGWGAEPTAPVEVALPQSAAQMELEDACPDNLLEDWEVFLKQ